MGLLKIALSSLALIIPGRLNRIMNAVVELHLNRRHTLEVIHDLNTVNRRIPFQGIPQMIYLDNGPVAKSHVFQQVMRYLDIDVRAHLPQGKDGRRVIARSKGKVERPF